MNENLHSFKRLCFYLICFSVCFCFYECETEATFQDNVDGKFEVIIAHPEALLSTTFGQRLLRCTKFTSRVVALVIDECHTVDLW